MSSIELEELEKLSGKNGKNQNFQISTGGKILIGLTGLKKIIVSIKMN